MPVSAPTPATTKADTLPASCGSVGAEGYAPGPYVIPPLDLTERGAVITVTGISDEIDGDTSSASALLRSPGRDRTISIDEAIDVTNRSPGSYTIRFDATLKGANIGITHPHPIRGGNVFLNGDVDGDGKPDVTLTRGRPGEYPALLLGSGGNRIHALGIDGLERGIIITPLDATGATFADNVLSNNVINADLTAIDTDSGTTARNRWIGLRILGNTLSAGDAGFRAALSSTAGNLIDGLLVARNTIRMKDRAAALSPAIAVLAGIGAGSDLNRIQRVLIAENVVEDAVHGIWLAAGMAGAARNVLDEVRVVSNRVGITPEKDSAGIGLVVGDGGTDEYDTSIQPIVYPDGNSMTNVNVEGNSVSTPGIAGIQTLVGCCGAEGSALDRVRIEGNVIDAQVCNGCQGKGIWLAVAFAGGKYSRPTRNSAAANIKVAHNTVRVATPADWPSGADLREPLNVPFAGISVEVGHHASDSALRDVEITANVVTTDAIGIAVLGGWNRGYDPLPTTGNVARSISITCDRVTTRPSLAGLSGLRGVTVIGGGRSASVTNNSVEVIVRDTLVVDKLNDIFVVANFDGAVGNAVQARKQ